MKIRIYIATTEGPVEVQRITKEDPDVRSVLCLNGTAKALPVSRAYDAFIKEPTGVVQRSYQHASYRMDVSDPITDGNSWQLGAFIAHALFAEDRLAGPDDKVDNAIWLTGEVDRDLNVRPVNHIEEKLLKSQALFQKLKDDDIRLFCFIPGGAGLVPDDDFLDQLEIDGEMRRLESVLDVKRITTRFSMDDPLPPVEEDEEEDDYVEGETIDLYKPEEGALPPIKDNKVTKTIVLILMILALFGGLYLQFEDNIIALRAGSIKLNVTELRANADKGCAQPDVIPLEKEGTAFPTSPIDGLCALQIVINNVGAPAHLWAFAQRLEDGHFLLADRESLMNQDLQKGLIGWQMELPKNLSRSIDYRIVALASSHPLSEPVNRMLRASFGEDASNWEKIKAQLVDEKITVISAVHSLEK